MDNKDKKNILIVDDSAETRLILSARLKAHHYHTIAAADALHAMSVGRGSMRVRIQLRPDDQRASSGEREAEAPTDEYLTRIFGHRGFKSQLQRGTRSGIESY
jgi:hypothetical protein